MVQVVESFGNLKIKLKNRFGADGGAGSKGQMGMKL